MTIKKHDKNDVISYDEFNKIIDHTNFHHDPPPREVIPDDENADPANEMMMGMEYDFDEVTEDENDEDAEYEKELALERADRDEALDYDDIESDYDGNPDDFEGDLSADLKQVREESMRNHT